MLWKEVLVDCMDIIIIKITTEMVTCGVNGAIDFALLLEKKKKHLSQNV